MAKILFGDRIGREAKLSVGCSAVIFDDSRQKILLTRRSDNGRWCLPGGHMEAGESAAEACMREVREETGLEVVVQHLLGVYSSPDRILEYRDGTRNQIVGLCFIAEITGGEPGLSEETTEIGFFTPDEIARLDLMENHRERIEDALANQPGAFIK